MNRPDNLTLPLKRTAVSSPLPTAAGLSGLGRSLANRSAAVAAGGARQKTSAMVMSAVRIGLCDLSTIINGARRQLVGRVSRRRNPPPAGTADYAYANPPYETTKTQEMFYSAAATALPQVTVSAEPLRSRVRSLGSASTRSMAPTMARAASASPR